MHYNLTLEGGGAKGLAHIGAISALSDYGLTDIKKVSGTSAGSIAAVLIIAGYSAKEIYDIYPDSNVVYGSKSNALMRSVASILLPILIVLFGLFYLFSPHYPLLFNAVLLGVITGIVSIAIHWTFKNYPIRLIRLIFRGISSIALLFIFTIVCLLFLLPGIFLFWGYGMFNTVGIETWLRKALIESPALKGRKNQHDKITFKELYQATNIEFTVISTNLNKRSIEIFSHLKTPDIDVVDAVVASSSIPIFFRYKEIFLRGEKQAFVDGGMVSNYPVWTMRGGIILDEFKQTIGIKLSDGNSKTNYLDSIFTYINSLFTTALWGDEYVDEQNILGLHSVVIDSGYVGTFSFNLTEVEKKAYFNSSKSQVKHYLESNFLLFSRANIENYLAKSSQMFSRYLAGITGIHIKYENIRANLIGVVDESTNVTKILYSHNMDDDLDRFIEFHQHEGIANSSLFNNIFYIVDVKNQQFLQLFNDKHVSPNNLYLTPL